MVFLKAYYPFYYMNDIIYLNFKMLILWKKTLRSLEIWNDNREIESVSFASRSKYLVYFC